MIDVVDGLDLLGLPIPFLEAYPFPAFVLAVPVPRRTRPPLTSRDTDVTIRRYDDDMSPLAGPSIRTVAYSPVAWANEKWLQLTEGRPLDECFEQSIMNRLQSGFEGGQDAPGDRTIEKQVFTLDMRRPVTRLHLTKTVVPLTPPSSTHAFCVVTSQVRSRKTSTISEHSASSTEFTPSVSSALDHSYATSRWASTSSDLHTSVSTEASSSPLSARGTAPGSYFPPPSRSSRSSQQDLRERSKLRSKTTAIEPIPVVQMQSAADECWAMMDSVDWSQTSLGPRAQWIDTIDPLLSVIFQSKTADCLWLGKDLTLIYNEPYSQVVPVANGFGRPGKEVWASIWEFLQPLLDQLWDGTPIYRENDMFSFKRWGPGLLLEHYHSYRYVPIVSRKGVVIGFFNQSIESTDQVLAERRLNTFREMSEQLLVARTTGEYYRTLMDVLEENPKDVPFALVFSVQQKEVTPYNVAVDVIFENAVGVPDNHPSAPHRTAMQLPSRSRASFGFTADRISSPALSAISAMSSGSGRILYEEDADVWPIQRALSTRQTVFVGNCRELIKGYPIREWDALPMSAIVVPICSETSIDVPNAVLVIGLNLCRPLDNEYEQWIHVIRSHMASSLGSVRAYEEERQRNEDNVKMERAKSAWFKGAAHDLRSPLTLVLGPLEDLEQSKLDPGQRYAVSIAQRNINRLLRLVNSLLDFSRLEAGRMEGRFVPTDLGPFVEDLSALFRPAIGRMRIRFQVEIEPSHKVVYIDPTLFETVISNLIGNALKYTEEGTITVTLRYTDDFAEVSVIDTGVGIPKGELPQISEWYHRATTAIHSGTEGTGLGLAIAKELLRLHEGELLISSCTTDDGIEPHGSTFTARVPLAPKFHTLDTHASAQKFGSYGKAVASEAMRWSKDMESLTDASSDVGHDSAIGSGTKMTDGLLFEKSDTLLIIDDNRDIREYIKLMFKPYCRILEAGSGEEGLVMARKDQLDLIISDVMMPKMTGLELVTEMRKSEATKLIPIILLSAMTEDEARVEALLLGAEDYLSKPFRPMELIARAHLHMQVGKKRRTLEKLFAEREVQMKVLSDYCPSGIMRANKDGRVEYANAAWREIAGFDPDDDPNEWKHKVDSETHTRLLGQWQKFLVGNERELKMTWKWTSGKTVLGLFIRLDMVMPTLSGLIGCMTDTSHEEQRLVEAELRRLEAEESKHQQELLIDLTSHEIRTPVSAILQCSSLVKENLVALKDQLRWSGATGFKPTAELLRDLDEDVEALESIYQCGLVQERIAGDVLSLARIQLDMLSMHDIDMDLRKEVRKVLSVFASEAKMKKIELSLEFGSTLTAGKVDCIKTDPVRLGQVVTNLISNAIRFTASSDVRKITVTYDIAFLPPPDDTCALPNPLGIPSTVPVPEDTPVWLYASVRDTGPGLGPKELAILFKRFSQGNKMIHTRYGGSGLGLFICRKIIEMLGGRIAVRSQLGQGSVFRFFIKTRTVNPDTNLAALTEATPFLPVTPLLMTPTKSSASSSSLASDGVVPEDMTDLHILIVEDNIINQTVLKRQIVKAGLTCEVANHGLEALTLIREADRQAKRGGNAGKRPYSCVLMDLEMPIMDGITAVKEIRAAEAAGTLGKTMVIALTGNARQGQIDQALAAGMDDVVIKPYVLSNLLEKIKTISMQQVDAEM